METFYNLINQIASFSEEELIELEQSYSSLFDGMVNNTELINETRHQMKAAGMTIADINNDKEEIYTIVKQIKSQEKLSERKERLLDKVVEITMGIYDKVIETGVRDVVNIPVELCRENARLPEYKHNDDAGFDIYLPENFTLEPGETKIAPTGLKMSIPTGYELQIRPRSGNSVKTKMRVANAPGTIDCGYADEIGVICDNIGTEKIQFKAGDRIAQGVLAVPPKGIFNKIDDINKVVGSNRGGGFGSTGK